MYYYQQIRRRHGPKSPDRAGRHRGNPDSYFRRRRPLTSHGTAEWASDLLLRVWGMLGKQGLTLARTPSVPR